MDWVRFGVEINFGVGVMLMVTVSVGGCFSLRVRISVAVLGGGGVRSGNWTRTVSCSVIVDW